MKKLLTAIKRCGTADKWGLIEKTDGLLLEPFSFSTTLTEECFSLIDKIAELTDLNNLFPKKNNIPTSPIAPPRNEQWNGARSIISVLG